MIFHERYSKRHNEQRLLAVAWKNLIKLKLIEFLNAFRASVLGISFGDQIQFFRREPILENKLYPDIPLMEDVELSLRLKALRRQEYLFGNAKVSARRWEKKENRDE